MQNFIPKDTHKLPLDVSYRNLSTENDPYSIMLLSSSRLYHFIFIHILCCLLFTLFFTILRFTILDNRTFFTVRTTLFLPSAWRHKIRYRNSGWLRTTGVTSEVFFKLQYIESYFVFCLIFFRFCSASFQCFPWHQFRVYESFLIWRRTKNVRYFKCSNKTAVFDLFLYYYDIYYYKQWN